MPPGSKNTWERCSSCFSSAVSYHFSFSLSGVLGAYKILGSEGFIELLPYGLITIVSAMFNSVFKTYSNLLIYQQRPMRFLWINISNFIITIAGSLILLYLLSSDLIRPYIRQADTSCGFCRGFSCIHFTGI